MQQIGVRELRQHASRYLARVAGGEEFGVTNHGRLVARLVPVAPEHRSRQALIDAGVIVPSRRPSPLAAILGEALPVGDLTRLLDDDRRDR